MLSTNKSERTIQSDRNNKNKTPLWNEQELNN